MKIRAFFGQSEFASSVLMLASGTVIAQVIPILVSPILTRIYTPDEFATFGLFSALVSIFGVVATGKYEFAIMLPEKERDALIIVVLSTIISIAVGIVLLVAVLFFHDRIIAFLGNPDFSLWLYLLPLGVVFAGFYQILNFWNNRKKAYPVIARSKIVRAVASNLINILLGFFKIGIKSAAAFGLIIGLIAGQLIEVLMLLKVRSLKNVKERLSFSISEIGLLARRYIAFPKYDVPSELMITASVQMPVLLLNRFFEQYVVGLYFHAHKVLSLPMSMIGSSIGQVLYKQLSDTRQNRSDFTDLVYKTYSRLILIGAIPFAFVGVFGPELFGIVFGQAWAESGIFARLIAPWLLFNFIGSPLTIIFSVLERQREMFFWIGVMFLSRVASLLFGFLYFKDVYYSIFLFSASGTVFYFVMNFYLVNRLAGVNIKDFLRATFIKPILILGSVLILKYIVSLLP